MLIEITWAGPYAWPSFKAKNNLPPIPEISGVYLQTFEYQNGYLIYCAGLTNRPVPVRFSEHTDEYFKGNYTVFDMAAMRQGIRKEVWHGWGYARKHRSEFEERKPLILNAVQKQLTEFRIFVGHLGKEPRLLERLEASVMNNLYQKPSPFCDIPDRGMHLTPRYDSEPPITVKNKCDVILHGLPPQMEI